MKKLLVFMIFCNFFLVSANSGQDSLNFQGHIQEVIKKQNNDRNDVYLKLLSARDSSAYFVDDFYLVFIIEQTHKLLLSDYVGKESVPEIGLKLENIEVIQKRLNGQKVNFISSMKKIFPDYPSERSYQYSDLNPGIPDEDYFHRYIEVPVSYGNPEMGTFRLYYELCSDFDESKPSIIIPTDGQRSLSQVGWADKYKENFALDYNTVTYEYRGMYASSIPEVENKNTDWNTIYEILNSDNDVKDIERIRKDIPGKGQIYVLGGSGTAMMGLKYLSNYPQKIKRAYLMSFFKDAKGSSLSGIRYFKNFINKNNLEEDYISALENENTYSKQVLFLLQRLLYFDEEQAKQLIVELSQNKFDLYKKYTKMLGSVDFFIRSARKYKPWSVTFMYETNINTSDQEIYNINYPFYEIAKPIRKARQKQYKSGEDLFDTPNLNDVQTEILLIAGSMDQVAPVNQLERIHRELPNSKLAIIKAYHCLQSSSDSKTCRNGLANLFFKSGYDSTAFEKYFDSSNVEKMFIELKE